MAQTWTLSGFGDEIAPDLTTQLDVLERNGIRHLELRSVDAVNVSEMSQEQLAAARATLDERGFKVSSIGSPVGKVEIDTDFDAYLDVLNHVLRAAWTMDTRYVRIFSFYIEPDRKDASRTEVLARMRELVERAAHHDVVLLHENEKGIYGDTPERCADLLSAIDSPNLRAVFDPANFVQIGEQPYPRAYELLRGWVDYVHVKDASAADGKVRPAGEGDARVPELLDELERSGYSGFLSLEPHLAADSGPGGGPEMFDLAARALRKLVDGRAGVTVR